MKNLSKNQLNENKTTALLAILISLLGVSPAISKQLNNALKDKPLTIQTFNDEINNISELMGGYNTTQIINIVSRTLFAEGSAEGTKGREAIATVIYNRAGGKPDLLADICLQPTQFSCWNKLTKRFGNEFEIKFPSNLKIINGKINKYEEKIWLDCVRIANEMVNGTFKPIANYNAYLNKKIASKDAVNTWGKKCTTKIGNHHFGYLPEWDGYKRNVLLNTKNKILKLKAKSNSIENNNSNIKQIFVKAGDTFYNIAKKYNTSVSNLKKLNPSIKDINKLKIGQKIFIKDSGHYI